MLLARILLMDDRSSMRMQGGSLAVFGGAMRSFTWHSSAILALFFVSMTGVAVKGSNVGVNLDGAWAESDESCKNAFTGKGGAWRFREPRDMFGSSYIISGRRYEGPFGVCNLVSTKPKGDKILLSLSCHNAIGYSNQVTPIQLTSSTEMIIFSADDMKISYKKCSR
jgi:hypothetical protein